MNNRGTPKKSKYTRVGSILRAKETNQDGTDRLYFKVERTVTLQEGESLNLFTPFDNAPDFVVFNVSKRNTEIE